jgi:hypothetical protein
MSTFFEAFLDGVTGAGLFGKLSWPGAPTEIIDSRSVEEFLASGDFDRSMASFGYHRTEEASPVQVRPAARRITIKGPRGVIGFLSDDGQSIKWFMDGVEVSVAELMQSENLIGEYVCTDRRSSSSQAAQYIHEHAGGR